MTIACGQRFGFFPAQDRGEATHNCDCKPYSSSKSTISLDHRLGKRLRSFSIDVRGLRFTEIYSSLHSNRTISWHCFGETVRHARPGLRELCFTSNNIEHQILLVAKIHASFNQPSRRSRSTYCQSSIVITVIHVTGNSHHTTFS